MDSKRLIGGLLTAAALGAAIGILLAPSSGGRTRSKLKSGSRRLTDDLQKTVAESIDSLKLRFNSGVDQAAKKGTEIVNHSREKVNI